MLTVAEPDAVREEKLESNEKGSELGRMMYMIIAYETRGIESKIKSHSFYGVRFIGSRTRGWNKSELAWRLLGAAGNAPRGQYKHIPVQITIIPHSQRIMNQGKLEE